MPTVTTLDPERRKVKKWEVLKRTAPGADTWTVLFETVSFDLAKKRVVEEFKTSGLDELKLVRTVDLYTVMYPIS